MYDLGEALYGFLLRFGEEFDVTQVRVLHSYALPIGKQHMQAQDRLKRTPSVRVCVRVCAIWVLDPVGGVGGVWLPAALWGGL